MSLFCTRRALSVALTLALGGSTAMAQQSVPDKPEPQKQTTAATTPKTRPDYAKPFTHFPNPVGPYIPHNIPEPAFSNTPRIDQLIKDGKLYLSLNDAIA